MKQITPVLFLLAIGLSLMTPASAGEKLNVSAAFSVPRFNSNAPTNFTDICYDSTTGKLALCSDGGYGEFPIIKGNIRFKPPGFVATTGNFIIRGYANTPVGLAAVDNRGRFVFWGKSGRIPLIADVGNICGMAWDGSRLWIARQLPAQLFAFRLETGKTLVLDQTVSFSFPVLQSVTFYNGSLWITDGGHIFRLNKQRQPIATWKLPAPISGFCFANHLLFAISIDGHTIYRLQHPE